MRGPDFIARLTYRTTEDGGRANPAASGYKPGIRFPFDPMQTSGLQVFIGQDMVRPGETVEAEIAIVSVEHFAGKLYDGLAFDFLEGPLIIGTGVILRILNPSLRRRANA